VQHHPNRLNTGESFIWLLDGEGNVTTAMNAASQGFRTLADILAAIGLPDTAMNRPPADVPPIGIILIGAAALLAVLRGIRRLLL
jgi:hypothetical protein